MKKKLLIIMVSMWLITTAFVWLSPTKISSDEERRKLSQFPTLSLSTVLNSEFSSNFEAYAQDQFPQRFKMRQAKAMFRYYGLGLFENNDFIIDHKKIMKIEYPLKESEIIKAGQTFESIREKYLQSNNVYVSIIPDKSYYTSKQTIPVMDYEKMETLLLDNMSNSTYVDIKHTLTLDDFYNTDIHWKQENLELTAETLLSAMNKEMSVVEVIQTDVPFTGVYSGHSALITHKDTINYVSNHAIHNASVRLLEEVKDSVYNPLALRERDQYDFFLYGPQAIVEIENNDAKYNDELIIFRDSFGSSIAPYFISEYKKVTLVDIRYISSSILDDYIDFNDQDVLFLFNGTILNSSSMFK